MTEAEADRPSFAHASEAELARILDFYEVRWAYEPDTFPIGWNLEGDVVESFSPDFYLPDVELYVELTTLKQKLVRKKNRKLRRLRELYPDVRIKLFYARDFRMLLLKFGRLALVDELSGTTGQATPARPAVLAATEPDPAAAVFGTTLDLEAVAATAVEPAAAEVAREPGLGPDDLVPEPVEAAQDPRAAVARRRRRPRRRRRATAVAVYAPPADAREPA